MVPYQVPSRMQGGNRVWPSMWYEEVIGNRAGLGPGVPQSPASDLNTFSGLR